MISTALLLTRSVNAQLIGGDEARCCLAFHSSVLKYSVVFASLGAGAAGQPYALGYGTTSSSRFVLDPISLTASCPLLCAGSYGGFGPTGAGRYPRAVVPPGAPEPPARGVGAVTFGHPLQPRLQMSTAPSIGWPGDPSRISR